MQNVRSPPLPPAGTVSTGTLPVTTQTKGELWRVPPGHEVLQLQRAPRPFCSELIGRSWSQSLTGHKGTRKWGLSMSSEGREQKVIMISGAWVCVLEASCPVASPRPPESPRLLPTSLLGTPGAQDHGPHDARVGGPHNGQCTLPKGSAAESCSMNVTPPGTALICM